MNVEDIFPWVKTGFQKTRSSQSIFDDAVDDEKSGVVVDWMEVARRMLDTKP